MEIENSASRRTYETEELKFSWGYSSSLNCKYLGPVCSIRLPQKKKGALKEILLYFE